MYTDQQQPPRRPDMDRVENGMKIIAEEIGNIVNIPAIQDARRITEAIHDMNTRLDGMNDQLKSLRQQLDASNHNQSARVFNNRLRDGCQQLTPFRDPRTNGVIVGFPVTGDALKELSIPQLDSIIAALDMQLSLGLQDDKVVALKMHIGAIFP